MRYHDIICFAIIPDTVDKCSMRKRGRKTKDFLDDTLAHDRKVSKRGIAYVDLPAHASSDDFTRAILARELEILKSRDFKEIREVPPGNNQDEDYASGSPVCARLLLPQMSIMNCLNNSNNQISYSGGGRNLQFTPECHVLMSKACEFMITELASRALIDASRDHNLATLAEDNLFMGIRNAWRAPGHDSQSNGAPFDFLSDLIDRMDTHIDPRDKLVRIHSKK